MRSDENRLGARPVPRFQRSRQSSMKRATSSGASCTRKAARSVSMPNRRKSSLKSSPCGDNAIASIQAIRSAVEQSGHRAIPGGIIVADDIQPTQRRWNRMAARCAAESAAASGMVGMTQRSDSMVSIPLAGSHHIARRVEANGIAEQMAHRAPRRVDWRLVGFGRV